MDLNVLEKITQFLVNNNVHATMPIGGTGEFPNLLREEKKEVISVVASVAKGKIPIITGTAACSTREVVLLSNDAYEAGADAVIVTAPYYFKLPGVALIKHYKRQSLPISIACW